MKTPFRLDDHPRRPQPLASPPDGYFNQLPMRVMQRVQPASAAGRLPVPEWLAALSAPLRTALAASVVLGGFAASFFLNNPGTLPVTAGAAGSLVNVPRTELVEYLLASEQRVTLSDLAELPATEQALPEAYLRASPAEVQDLLDAQPTEDIYL